MPKLRWWILGAIGTGAACVAAYTIDTWAVLRECR